MKYPIGLSVLSVFMFFNWLALGQVPFSLFALGFVVGVCVSSWIIAVGRDS